MNFLTLQVFLPAFISSHSKSCGPKSKHGYSTEKLEWSMKINLMLIARMLDRGSMMMMMMMSITTHTKLVI